MMKHDYHSLRIAEVRRDTRDCVSFGLAVPPALAETFRFEPGQHLAVRCDIAGEEVRRTYSISSGPSDPLLWITVKRVADGVFSSWAHDTLRAGHALECMAPAGRLVLPTPIDGTGARCVIAVVAGSGITPVMSIIEHVLAREPGSRVALIYGNRTVDDIIFRERLEGLKNRHLERLQIFHVLSRDSEADVPVLSGRIDGAKIATLVGNLRPTATDDVLLCGPDSLIKNSRDALIALGITRARIRFEYFRAGPESPAGRRRSPTAEPAAVGGTQVIAVVDGVRRSFTVGANQHVIDAALAAGIKLPYSCKGGMCCTCRAKLVEGEVVMDRNFSLEGWEMQAGFVLTCQARPTTRRVVLDYDSV